MLHPNVGVYCIRKVKTTLKESVYKRHKENFSKNNLLGGYVIENKTDLKFEVRHNGSSIKCIGLDDPEKVKSVEGVTIIHWEEGTEVTQEDFDTVDAGLSPAGYPAIHIITHNPVPQIPGEPHWLSTRFLNRVEHKLGVLAVKDDFAVLKVNLEHNKFCPEAVKKVIKGYKKTNPILYKMWYLGEFVDFEGLIFPHIELVKEVPPELNFLGYGLDFGFSNDPAALIAVWGNSDTICMQGLLYETGLTNPELIEAMKEAGVTPNDDIVGDSSEPKSLAELEKVFPLIEGVKKYTNYKTDVIKCLYGYRLTMVDDDINLQREKATYCWDTKRSGRLKGRRINKPADGNDHYMDALIMLCAMKLGIPKGRALETVLI